MFNYTPPLISDHTASRTPGRSNQRRRTTSSPSDSTTSTAVHTTTALHTTTTVTKTAVEATRLHSNDDAQGQDHHPPGAHRPRSTALTPCGFASIRKRGSVRRGTIGGRSSSSSGWCSLIGRLNASATCWLILSSTYVSAFSGSASSLRLPPPPPSSSFSSSSLVVWPSSWPLGWVASSWKRKRRIEIGRPGTAVTALVRTSWGPWPPSPSTTALGMVMTRPPNDSIFADESFSSSSSSRRDDNNNNYDPPPHQRKSSTKATASRREAATSSAAAGQRVREKYKRKHIPESERKLRLLRAERQAAYDQVVGASTDTTTSMTSMSNNNTSKTTTTTTTRTIKELSPIAPATSSIRSSRNITTTTLATPNNKPTRNTMFWSFESLFPEPVWDQESIMKDLYEVQQRDRKTYQDRQEAAPRTTAPPPPTATTTCVAAATSGKLRSSFFGGTSMMRIWRDPKISSAYLPTNGENGFVNGNSNPSLPGLAYMRSNTTLGRAPGSVDDDVDDDDEDNNNDRRNRRVDATSLTSPRNNNVTRVVDQDLTRMVESRMYGYRRTPAGDFQYETSLMGDGAVQFRDGVRLGNPLRVNADRLNYFAKKELQHGRVEEAEELYEEAIRIDPRDGRAYLGLSRCAERRRDFILARKYLQVGVATSVSVSDSMVPDRGANPYLLQALGCLEEKMGHLSEAEALYVSAVRSRPSHAASWVALAQLRTQKLGQGVASGRWCYQAAARELKQAGLPPSAYVYTAWAALEYQKANDVKRARELFKMALEVDPKSSAAWLQLGVMESNCQNWPEAQNCFDTVMKFDQRNSRVLQAYAIMEGKRPGGSSRKAIGLFERALQANPRDAGVVQAYALYVAELGDIAAARDLLKRGTEVNKRHAPVWQAWGVLETHHGHPETARHVFQQGIWACATLSGSQSGGYDCARLWQAWGVLEAQQGDADAARRCFSRALDADSRNLPAFTAWAAMEEKLGQVGDARAILECALRRFAAGSTEKVSLWRTYELMEQRLGHVAAAQNVYQRSMREALSTPEVDHDPLALDPPAPVPDMNTLLKSTPTPGEVEVLRWKSGGGEVWFNDRAIEGKVPFDMKKRKKSP